MTKEECIERAKPYVSKTEFSQKDKTAYDFARKNDLLDCLFIDRRTISKYKTDEEKKEAHRQSCHRYRATHKKQISEKLHDWYISHKTEAKAYQDRYRSEHLEKKREYINDWRKKNNFAKKQRDYRKTKAGRALALAAAYKNYDSNRFSSNNTVSKTWIIEKLFSGQHCIYCGDGNWRHLGADRIDNKMPHTADNILCSCGICNVEREIVGMNVEDFKVYRKNNPLPKWSDEELER